MNEFLGLIVFSFVSAATLGPNNIRLWASGAEFGFLRTLRHVFGTALGIGLMAPGVAEGFGLLIPSIPELAFAMKVAGSAYLLYLAVQVGDCGRSSGATSAGRWASSRRPPSRRSTPRRGSSPSGRSRRSG